MKRIYHHILPFLLLTFGTLIAPANLAGQDNWEITYLGFGEGLPDRTTYASVFDSLGFMWLATGNGLCRYDGLEVTTFPTEGDTDFNGRRYNGNMVIDAHRRLISMPYRTTDSLEIFDLSTYQSYGLGPAANDETNTQRRSVIRGQHLGFYGKNGDDFYSLYRTEDSLLIFSLDEQLSWKPFRTYANIPPLQLQDLDRVVNIDSEEVLLYLGGNRVLQLRGEDTLKTFTLPHPPTLLHRDRQGRCWFTTESQQGLFYVNPQFDEIQQWTAATPLLVDSLVLNQVWEDQQGQLIFSSFNGNYNRTLFLIDTLEQTTPLDQILARENKILSLTGEDFNQEIRVSSYGGFYRFTRPVAALELTNYLDTILPIGGFGYVMRGMTSTPDGNTVYVNSSGGRWFTLQAPDYLLQQLPLRDEHQQIIIPDSMAGCGGNLLFHEGYIYGLSCNRTEGRHGYIHRYDPTADRWDRFSIPEERTFGRVLIKEPEGTMLLFTLNIGNRDANIYRFNPQNGRFNLLTNLYTPQTPRNLKASFRNAVYDTLRQRVWIASYSGLYAFDPVSFSLQSFRINDWTANEISSLILLPDHRLLLGTNGQGLQLFDPDNNSFQVAGRVDPGSEKIVQLPHNQISDLALIDEQFILVTTTNGLALVDWQSKQAFPYNEGDGLPNNEFNRLAIHISPAGQVFAGGINGFSRIPLAQFLPAQTAPTPTLTGYFEYDEREKKETTRILPPQAGASFVISPSTLYFGFQLALNDFTAPQDNLFQTWLEGSEPFFGPLTNQTQVRYNRLPPGKYRLHVRAVTPGGDQSHQDLVIPIRVQRPWYQRTWAIISGLLMIFALAWYLDRRRMARIKREEEMKREAARQLAELELQILRQQLNPHFIYNSLAAIQHFIQTHRGSIAIDYLADFAKLMRLFLESSKRPFIFLREELELIRLYVRLEQMRFNQRFTVAYHIDEQIDQDMEEIPSLLLQPFIENAINHGLFHLKEAGHLAISFQLDDQDRIICIITDNGIGRVAAAKLRAQSYKKHKSRATQIVEERLMVFQQTGDTDLEIFTEDLHPAQEHTGTKVTIIVGSGED